MNDQQNNFRLPQTDASPRRSTNELLVLFCAPMPSSLLIAMIEKW